MRGNKSLKPFVCLTDRSVKVKYSKKMAHFLNNIPDPPPTPAVWRVCKLSRASSL